jgi:trk system potassium uptake protein TrkA
MRILIVGCGRVGSLLATDFHAQSHEVSVVDSNSRAFRRLPPDFSGNVVLGTGIDEDVLRSAGVETADVYIAVTDNDNTNIMSAQIARTVYGIQRVILRIYDPVRAEIFRGLGLSVICPTTTVAGLFEEQVLRGSRKPART